jgi:hypothetical protein
MHGESAEAIAIQALSFLAEDAERLGRFLALTGISPAEIRKIAREPGFLAAVLDHLAGNEPLLLRFAAQVNRAPAEIAAARTQLGGKRWERHTA